MEAKNLTHVGNLSYTARRAVGYDSKGSISVFWKIGIKQAERICSELGIPFYVTIAKETEIDVKHLQKMRELESLGMVEIRRR